jgi:adenosylcobinamide-GDP ribazoletransferase
VFLTRIPVGGFPFRAEEAAWASAWFPTVGAGVGILLAGVWRLAALLDPLPAACFTLTVGLLVTGALHEDGLADTADALGGATDREGVLRILKDSRIGAYGAVALVASFALRAALLASMPGRGALALVVSQCGSRLPAVWLLALLPYITPQAESRSRAIARATGAQAALATSSLLLLLGVLTMRGALSWSRAVGVFAVAGAVVGGCGAFYRRRLGGVTGDLLGASQQVAEIGMLAVLAAHQRW